MHSQGTRVQECPRESKFIKRGDASLDKIRTRNLPITRLTPYPVGQHALTYTASVSFFF